MARKRNDLGDAVSDRILALMQAGGTAESITRQLSAEGVTKISRATIGRRMTELRPRASKARADRLAKPKSTTSSSSAPSSARVPLPSSPEEIPADAEPSVIDGWLRKARAMADAAYAAGDLDGFGKMGRLTSALLEAKRKATPPPAPDPNDRPDMIAARERARDAFHKLIDRVLPSKGET